MGAQNNFTGQVFTTDSAVVKYKLIFVAWRLYDLCNASKQAKSLIRQTEAAGDHTRYPRVQLEWFIRYQIIVLAIK